MKQLLQYFKKHLYFTFEVCFIYLAFPNTFIFSYLSYPVPRFCIFLLDFYQRFHFLTEAGLNNDFFLKRQFLKIFFWEPELIQMWFYIISIPIKVIVKLQIRHQLAIERPCLPEWSKRKSIFEIVSRHYNLANWILSSFPLKTQVRGFYEKFSGNYFKEPVVF